MSTNFCVFESFVAGNLNEWVLEFLYVNEWNIFLAILIDFTVLYVYRNQESLIYNKLD